MKFSFTALALSTALVGAAPAHAEQFKVLLFTKTAGWHHDAVHAGVSAVQELGKLHDFGMFWTADAGRVMNDAELAKYGAVIFLLTTGDVLDDAQQAAFERYIRKGGGFVGVHSASDTEYGWPWYTKMVGHMFKVHPAVQTAVLQVRERNFPGMERFAPRTLFTDEWYEFGPATSNRLTYLLSVDESTYAPKTTWPDREGAGMGAFHPISWYQPYEVGAPSTRRWGIWRRPTAIRSSCTTCTAGSTGRRPGAGSGRTDPARRIRDVPGSHQEWCAAQRLSSFHWAT